MIAIVKSIFSAWMMKPIYQAIIVILIIVIVMMYLKNNNINATA
jgi:hypothetical protein